MAGSVVVGSPEVVIVAGVGCALEFLELELVMWCC